MKEEMERERAKREVKPPSDDPRGQKREREGEEEERKVGSSTASMSGATPVPYSRYPRPPDAEINEYHRNLRRSDDPMNSVTFSDTT